MFSKDSPPPVGHPGAPQLSGLRQLGFDVVKAATLKCPKSPLAQAHMGAQRRPGGLGHGQSGGMGALQVAAVNGVNGFSVSQGLRQQLGLALAVIVEGNVGVALDAGAGVPSGFTMSNGHDAGRNHGFSLSPRHPVNGPPKTQRFRRTWLKCLVFDAK
jgi:hypothetical protein